MGEAKRKKMLAQKVTDTNTSEAEAFLRDIGIPIPNGMDHADPGLMKAAVLGGSLRSRARNVMANHDGGVVNKLLGLTAAFLKSLDEAVDKAMGQSRQLSACKKGCAWCCYQNVEASIPEAILVAVQTGADARGTAFDERSKGLEGVSDVDRLLIDQPCPFLGEGAACTIYEERPSACRAFLSPDAAACETGKTDALAGRESFISSYATPQLFGGVYRSAISAAAKDVGLQSDIVDLVQTVAAIRNNPSLIDRWANGESVFSPKGHAKSYI